MGRRPQTDKPLPQGPFTGKVFYMTFCIAFYQCNFSSYPRPSTTQTSDRSCGTCLLLNCLLLGVRRIVRWGDDCVGGISSGGGGRRQLRHSRAHSLQAAQLRLQFSLLALQLRHLQTKFLSPLLVKCTIAGLGLLEVSLSWSGIISSWARGIYIYPHYLQYFYRFNW